MPIPRRCRSSTLGEFTEGHDARALPATPVRPSARRGAGGRWRRLHPPPHERDEHRSRSACARLG